MNTLLNEKNPINDPTFLPSAHEFLDQILSTLSSLDEPHELTQSNVDELESYVEGLGDLRDEVDNLQGFDEQKQAFHDRLEVVSKSLWNRIEDLKAQLPESAEPFRSTGLTFD